MAPTLEAFKKAFAGKVSPDLVSNRDQQVTAALKTYSQAVGDAKLDPTQAKAAKGRLVGLVQRFDKVKKSRLSPKEQLDELDDILRNANSGMSELTQPTAPPPPAPPPPPSPPPQLSSGPPNQLQLLVEKKQLEEKLGKNSYIGEDADRRRLEEINALLDQMDPIPIPSAPKAQPVDNRPTAGELVARDKQAALDKRAYDLGYADGLKGESLSGGVIATWKEALEDQSVLLALINGPYTKGFTDGKKQGQNELAEAHKTWKATGKFSKTKHPYMKAEIRAGRTMTVQERMDAMLKAQGKTIPTMDSIGFGEVDTDYITVDEFRKEVLKRAKVEHDACKQEYIRPGKIRKCIAKVDEKYGGPGFQDWDRKEAQKKYQQIKAVADRIEDVKNAGPVKLVGKAVGRGVGYAIGGDEGAEIGDQIGGMVGGVGDIKTVKKTADVAKKRNADYGKSNTQNVPPTVKGPPADSAPRVKVTTARGTVEMTKTEISVEQVKAQKWIQEQRAADANRVPNQRRSDAQLIKEMREQFKVDKGWEPFAPHERQVTVDTPKGPVQMTVQEYRDRVAKADAWVAKEKMATKDGKQIKSDEQLHREAADKFGLDGSWGAINNPNYHGSRVQPAPPKGESVSFNQVRYQAQHKLAKLVESASPAAHEKGWRDLGHTEKDVPPAYLVNGTIHVDMTKWPAGLPRDWDPVKKKKP